jgi:hypothetical protein
VQPREYNSSDWCSKEAYMTAIYQIGATYLILLGFFLLLFLLYVYSKLCRFRAAAAAEEEQNNEENGGV